MSTPAKKATPAFGTLSNKPTVVHDDSENPVITDEKVSSKFPIGPDSHQENVHVDVPPVKSTESNRQEEPDKADKPILSKQVVSTVPNRTPAELAAESPDETAERYGIDQTVTEEDIKNPRVQVYRDTKVNQVPSGTHLHPDVAKDLLNRGIAEQTTDVAQVRRTIVDGYDFAPDAEQNDKFQKPVEEPPVAEEFDRDEDYTDDDDDVVSSGTHLR